MSLHRPTPDSPEALARVLAVALASNDAIDDRAYELLDQLDAYERLGVPEPVFRRMVQGQLAQLGGRFADKPWLSLGDILVLDEVLDAVRAPALRLRVCRLVAGVITADGAVSAAERLVYDHMLMRWHIHRSDVVAAIRADPVPSAAMPLMG